MSEINEFDFTDEEHQEITRIHYIMGEKTTLIKEKLSKIECKYNNMFNLYLNEILKRKLIELGLNISHFKSQEYQELFRNFCKSWHSMTWWCNSYECRQFMKVINEFVEKRLNKK